MIYANLAAMAIRLATALFVDDAVSYRVAPVPFAFDSLTGVASVSLTPDIPIGCDMPRITFDSATSTFLAAHCYDAETGSYFPYHLLAE